MNEALIPSPAQHSIVLIVVLPILGSFLLPILERISSRLAQFSGPAVLLISLWVCIDAWLSLSAPIMIAMGGFAPPLGIVFYVDQLAILFSALILIMALLLWPYPYKSSIREYNLTLLITGAGCGLALSGDLFNIYVFYELVSVASFGLVASAGQRAAYAASIRYVFISGFGTVLALTGIALVYTQTGTLNLAQLAQLAPHQLDNNTGITAFALILIGIGVKAELFPVNTWVPEVYASSRKRVSALLAGVVSKLAIIVLLRLLILVFQSEQALSIMLILGLLGIISGELAAWRAKDLSRMLAYSSIGQLGLIFVAFSIPGETGVFAGLALSLHHLVVKPALFLLAERWGHSIAALSGAARQSPLAALLFVLFALSLIGVPPLPGFWAKLLTVTGLLSMDSGIYNTALAIILIATVIEANYLFRVVILLYNKEKAESAPHLRLDLATSGFFAFVLIMSAVFFAPLGQHLQHTAHQVSNIDTYISTVFPGDKP